jgi:hypothetical protein
VFIHYHDNISTLFFPIKESRLNEKDTCEDAAKGTSVKYLKASGSQEGELARNQKGKTVGQGG